MKKNYLKNPHNKVFIKNKIIYKFFKSDKKYFNEKRFYMKYNIPNIPKLLCFSDNRRLLIFNNVGVRIKKRNIDFIKLKLINDNFIKNNIFHNDFRVKNILYNKKENNYYFIDWEHYDIFFKDYRKSPLYDDLRNELFHLL